MKIKEAGEFGLIDKINIGLITNPERVIKGIGDDTAVLNSDPSKVILFTTDMLVEGVHFKLDFSTPKQVGLKALAVNISDIAAMGGMPTNAVISIGISGESDIEIVEGIYEGLREMCAKYQINIVGGDTVSSNDLIINVALMGEVEKEQVIYRSGAETGDYIYVTGPLGDSAAGLHLLTESKGRGQSILREHLSLVEKHLAPEPRLIEAQMLVNSGYISAMNDISDGLASELHEIGEQSNVGFKIYESKLPLSNSLRNLDSSKINSLELALFGGEDFELVFTVRAKDNDDFQKYITEKQLKVHLIGETTAIDGGYTLIDKHGQAGSLESKGYNHFRSE